MTEDVIPLSEDEPEKDILGQAMGMYWSCARFVTLVVRDRGDGTFELIYVFHVENEIVEKRFVIHREWELESISDLWAGALLIEKEAIDLFGIKIKGLQGGILLVPGKSPVNPLRMNREGGEGGG
jgi:NADH:ubiquinone oxidoreductase subunit C